MKYQRYGIFVDFLIHQSSWLRPQNIIAPHPQWQWINFVTIVLYNTEQCMNGPQVCE